MGKRFRIMLECSTLTEYHPNPDTRLYQRLIEELILVMKLYPISLQLSSGAAVDPELILDMKLFQMKLKGIELQLQILVMKWSKLKLNQATKQFLMSNPSIKHHRLRCIIIIIQIHSMLPLSMSCICQCVKQTRIHLSMHLPCCCQEVDIILAILIANGIIEP